MPTANFREFDILISLAAGEEKFGFSVVGGVDKGSSPKIGKIADDSPAVRAKLRSGDELLAVNGTNVENETFHEIVSFVLKAAKIRSVRLTVKRCDEPPKPKMAPPPPPRNQNRPKEIDNEVQISTSNGYNDAIKSRDERRSERDASRYEDKEFLNQFDHRNVDSRHRELKDNVPNFEGFDEDFGHTNADINSSAKPRLDVTSDLIKVLAHLSNTVTDEKDKQDLEFLKYFCQHGNFHKASKAHAAYCYHYNLCADSVIHGNAQELAQTVSSEIDQEGGPVSTLLQSVLKLPNVASLLYCYDQIATKAFPPYDDLVPSKNDDFCYRLVTIPKTEFPLGATIRRYGNKIVINRIARKGAADRSGLMSEGDEVIKINDIDVAGMAVIEIVDFVEKQEDVVRFLILPGDNTKTSAKDSSVFVKSYCDYNPIEDQFNPYRELGLKFQYGDILRITPQQDKNWWQAQLIFSSQPNVTNKSLSGIIPSKHLMEQRQSLRDERSHEEEPNVSPNAANKKKWLKISGKSKKKKNENSSTKGSLDTDIVQILTYEEVREMTPTFNRTRPVVLIGAKYVGRNELKHRLLRGQPERFDAAVECTTRAPRPNEVNGVDFHFITRDIFESKKTNHEMLECRESNGQLYGVDKDAVREVMLTSKSCILILEPEMLPRIRTAELRPFVIFIRAPLLNEIGKTSRGNYDCINFSVKMKNDAVRAMVNESYDIELKYKQYFDVLLVNNDMVKLANEVKGIVESLTSAPQWVPHYWMH